MLAIWLQSPRGGRAATTVPYLLRRPRTQVQEKLSDIARFQKGEPDAAEIAAAKEAQEKRNKKVIVRASCVRRDS